MTDEIPAKIDKVWREVDGLHAEVTVDPHVIRNVDLHSISFVTEPPHPEWTVRSVHAIFERCPLCEGEMREEHAHYRCPTCGFRDSCCE